jgi:hypothetical protein
MDHPTVYPEELHAQICKGKLEAIERLWTAMLPPFERSLRRVFPCADRDVCVAAAGDAILEYLQKPAAFDPKRGVPLNRFLYQAALRNVADFLRAERRRHAREAMYANEMRQCRSDEGVLVEDPQCDWTAIGCLVGLSDAECTAARLWLSGERRTQVLARALAVQQASVTEQRVIVKKLKDRIRKRLYSVKLDAVALLPVVANKE